MDATRRRDLLQTLVMLGIVLTPAWLLPEPFARVWLIGGLLIGVPAVFVAATSSMWLPTPAAELDRIVSALALGPQDRFCDLGAGDGRIVVAVHRRTRADCTGIELSPGPYLAARVRLALQGSQRTHMQLRDWYSVDLSAYDALYVWGTPYSVGTARFADHVRTQAKPGARVVSYAVPLSDWTPEHVDDGGQRPLYVYAVPVRARQ